MLASSMLISNEAAASLSVKPEAQTISVKPGKKARGSIVVKNNMDSAVRIDVQPEYWAAQGHEILKEVSWLKVTPPSFVLGPGKSKKVKVSALITDESPATRVTYIFFAFRNAQSIGDVSVGMRIGSIIQWKVLH